MSVTEINFDIKYENERVERILLFAKEVYEKLYPMGSHIYDNFKITKIIDDKGILYFDAYIEKCDEDDIQNILEKTAIIWEYQGETEYKLVIRTKYKEYTKISEYYPTHKYY